MARNKIDTVIFSSCNLTSFITDMFLEWYYHIRHYRAHVYLVKFLFFSFMLLPVGEIKMNKRSVKKTHKMPNNGDRCCSKTSAWMCSVITDRLLSCSAENRGIGIKTRAVLACLLSQHKCTNWPANDVCNRATSLCSPLICSHDRHFGQESQA